jgi:hypothetical protein
MKILSQYFDLNKPLRHTYNALIITDNEGEFEQFEIINKS